MGCGDEKLKRLLTRTAIGAVPLGYLGLAFFLPLGVVVAKVAGVSSRLSVDIPVALQSSLEIAQQAAIQAVLSAALTILFGLPLAGLLAQTKFFGKSLLSALVMVPFVLPTLVTGLALRSLFADLIQPGLILLLIGHVYVNLAVVVRVVGSAWSGLDSRLDVVAAALGADPMQLFRTVTLPLLRPAISQAAGLIFIFTFSSLGLVLLLGGDAGTLETQLLRQIALLVDFPAASVTALLQFGVVLIVLAITNRNQQFIDQPTRTVPKQLGRKGWLGVGLYFSMLTIPLLALVYASFNQTGQLSFAPWQAVLQDVQIWIAASVSLRIALLTAFLAVTLGVLVAFVSRFHSWRWLPTLFALPLSVSSVTIGLGLLLTYGGQEFWALPRWLIPSIAHSLIALPFVIAVVLPAIKSLDPTWITTAASLGARPWIAYKTAFYPVLSRVVPVGLTLAVAVSLGEFGAASFLADSQNPTLSVLLLRLASRPATEAFGMAAALAVLVGLITLLLTFAWQRLEDNSNG